MKEHRRCTQRWRVTSSGAHPDWSPSWRAVRTPVEPSATRPWATSTARARHHLSHRLDHQTDSRRRGHVAHRAGLDVTRRSRRSLAAGTRPTRVLRRLESHSDDTGRPNGRITVADAFVPPRLVPSWHHPTATDPTGRSRARPQHIGPPWPPSDLTPTSGSRTRIDHCSITRFPVALAGGAQVAGCSRTGRGSTMPPCCASAYTSHGHGRHDFYVPAAKGTDSRRNT